MAYLVYYFASYKGIDDFLSEYLLCYIEIMAAITVISSYFSHYLDSFS